LPWNYQAPKLKKGQKPLKTASAAETEAIKKRTKAKLKEVKKAKLKEVKKEERKQARDEEKRRMNLRKREERMQKQQEFEDMVREAKKSAGTVITDLQLQNAMKELEEERDGLGLREDNMERLKEAPFETSKGMAGAEGKGAAPGYQSTARAEAGSKGSTKFGTFVRKI